MSFFRPEIDAMAGYQAGEQPQGGKFIKLNTNENPYPPSPVVQRAIQVVLKNDLARYPDPLAEAFRARAAELFGVSPDWILCGNGSDDILTIVTRAFVGEGQRLRIPHPSYVLYRTLAEIQGAHCDEITFNQDWSLDNRFSSPLEGLRLAYLPNPNSPSGTLLQPARINELATALPCPLLVDEAYVDFADVNCIRLVAENEKVLVSRTLSKSYALAGLRFGYVVAQPHIIEGLTKVKDSYNCDAVSIAAATAAIDDQDWLRENRAKIIATRQGLEDGMRNRGFEVTPSQANFVWCTHPEIAAESVYQRLKSQRILVRYMNFDGWGDGLRVSVGTDQQVDAMLALLDDIT
ncbi:MAG: histidinol-phosphate transaminase [Planctomycetota bacterium]|nr:histidinol-phosphate transaminase [Planctomycetota bacterium]